MNQRSRCPWWRVSFFLWLSGCSMISGFLKKNISAWFFVVAFWDAMEMSGDDAKRMMFYRVSTDVNSLKLHCVLGLFVFRVWRSSFLCALQNLSWKILQPWHWRASVGLCFPGTSEVKRRRPVMEYNYQKETRTQRKMKTNIFFLFNLIVFGPLFFWFRVFLTPAGMRLAHLLNLSSVLFLAL